MTVPKKYFHDPLVLLLLSINTFLAVVGSMTILLRLDSSRAQGYIVQYRANLGISAFKAGSASNLLAFVGFLLIVLVIHIVVSMRVYHLHRPFAITVLSLGVLLLVLGIIVGNALTLS